MTNQLEFTFTIRDLIYLVALLFSFAGTYYNFHHRQKKNDESISLIKNIIFDDRNVLRIIDKDTMKQSLDGVYTAIRKSDTLISESTKKIETMNENIIKIMTLLNLEPSKFDIENKNAS